MTGTPSSSESVSSSSSWSTGTRLLGAIGGRADLEQEDGDVVLAAALVGCLDQLLRGLLEVGAVPLERLLDRSVVDHVAEPVGAKEEDVAFLGLDPEDVAVHVRVGSERPGDHGALRVRLGLLLGQLSGARQLGDERVVVGDLLELVVTEAVRARVADVAERDRALVDERERQCRPHAGQRHVLLRLLVDAAVRGLDQRLDALLARSLPVLALLERLRGEPRGHFSGLRSAHPVRDREEGRFADEDVLVVPPAAAGICLGDELAQRHRSNLKSLSPILTMSPGSRRFGRFSFTPFT